MTRGKLPFLTSNGLRCFQRDLNAPFLNQRCFGELRVIVSEFSDSFVARDTFCTLTVRSAKSLDYFCSFGYFSINTIVMIRFYTYV